MIGVGDLRFGDNIYHKKVGKITVMGFEPHCGDFAVFYINEGGHKSWVFLKNCSYFSKEDVKTIIDANENPSEPNEELIKLAKEFKNRSNEN